MIVLGSLTPVFLVMCAVGVAQAQTPPPIKPGLWQVQTERGVDGQKTQMLDLIEHLKNLPPESRKQVEAMMKQRGVDSSVGGGAMRICMTKESLFRPARNAAAAHRDAHAVTGPRVRASGFRARIALPGFASPLPVRPGTECLNGARRGSVPTRPLLDAVAAFDLC